MLKNVVDDIVFNTITEKFMNKNKILKSKLLSIGGESDNFIKKYEVYNGSTTLVYTLVKSKEAPLNICSKRSVFIDSKE